MEKQSIALPSAQTNGTILVADDERHIVQLIKLYLRNEGFGVETATNGQEALAKVDRFRPDLLILDLMMPNVDGWDVCRRLRKDRETPIITLTARTDDVDKIVGLELGADDYVTKPFNPRELVARVKAVLRRANDLGLTTSVVEVGDLRIDEARREVAINGMEIKLRTKEFDLLLALSRRVGVVLTRDMLLSGVWGYDYFGESRTVDVHVTWLRSKIAESTVRIETVRGVGYKLVGPVVGAGSASTDIAN